MKFLALNWNFQHRYVKWWRDSLQLNVQNIQLIVTWSGSDKIGLNLDGIKEASIRYIYDDNTNTYYSFRKLRSVNFATSLFYAQNWQIIA